MKRLLQDFGGAFGLQTPEGLDRRGLHVIARVAVDDHPLDGVDHGLVPFKGGQRSDARAAGLGVRKAQTCDQGVAGGFASHLAQRTGDLLLDGPERFAVKRLGQKLVIGVPPGLLKVLGGADAGHG